MNGPQDAGGIPPRPWLAVRIAPAVGFPAFEAAAAWLGDAERSVAWALLAALLPGAR